jgi:hypothetical protein
MDFELDSNLNCFWPPPRGLEPDQPWTFFLTWKPLLDFFYSIPCTNHGRMHGCHVLITAAYIRTQVLHEHPFPGSQCSSDRSLMPSTGLPGPQGLQNAQGQMSDYYKVPLISTQ